jgi:hypothetical protein
MQLYSNIRMNLFEVVYFVDLLFKIMQVDKYVLDDKY